MRNLTERQLDTLIAIVAHHRAYNSPVSSTKLTRFTKTQVAVMTSHLCRLVQYRFIQEKKTGFVPTIDGETFAITCRYVGERNFGRTYLAMYAPAA